MLKKEINYNSPIYLQLREVVREKIETNQYIKGSAIPSEITLAKTYGVNRLTVRNAIDALVSEGLLKRVQGKGVYVTNKYERDLEVLGGFTQTMTEKNIQSKVKILKRIKKSDGQKYKNILNIGEDDDIYYIKRLDYANNDPIAIQEIYIPSKIVPNIDDIDLSVFSMFEIYNLYGIKPVNAWQTLDIIKLAPSDARLININKDDSVFLFCCTTFDENGNIIEYSKSYTRSDKCNFAVTFSK